MAGYNKIYFVGGQGGFMGTDGINPILFEILIGDADRQWVEVFYHDNKIKPLGNIKKFVPGEPNNPIAILDACIIFYPEFFKECATMPIIKANLTNDTTMDFNLGKNIPKEWDCLRKEAREYINKLAIYEANLNEINTKRLFCE